MIRLGRMCSECLYLVFRFDYSEFSCSLNISEIEKQTRLLSWKSILDDRFKSDHESRSGQIRAGMNWTGSEMGHVRCRPNWAHPSNGLEPHSGKLKCDCRWSWNEICNRRRGRLRGNGCKWPMYSKLVTVLFLFGFDPGLDRVSRYFDQVSSTISIRLEIWFKSDFNPVSTGLQNDSSPVFIRFETDSNLFQDCIGSTCKNRAQEWNNTWHYIVSVNRQTVCLSIYK